MVKLLRSLKKFFAQSATPRSVAIGPPEETETLSIETGRPLSQVEKNLSWIPINREPNVLTSLTPPACPDLILIDALLLQRYRAFVVEAEQPRLRPESKTFADEGSQLARELHDRAVDLAYSRETDSSWEVYWLMQCAAIISLFAFGRESAQFLGYRKEVHSHNSSAIAREQVQLFDDYVTSRSDAR